MEGCALSKGDSLWYQKRIYFPYPSFWIFLFFCLFQFLKSLKKNKRILCYKGGTSVTNNNTISRPKEHTNSQNKETCVGKGHSGKIPPWVKELGCRGKVLQGLRIRHDSKV
jgi:hypothetical protein